MSKVIDFQAAKQELEPHLSGKARCLACRHEWMAVAPVGTVWLDCPACSLEKGRLLGVTLRNDGQAHWHCNCGNELFYATSDGMYCPNCGAWQHGF